MYADDTSAFVLEDTMEAAVNKLQNFVNSCNSQMENEIFSANCKLMMFTQKRVTIHPHIFVKNKKKIKYATKSKYL